MSLLNNTGANPADFTGSVPRLTVLPLSRAPGCSGGTDGSWEPGAYGDIAARKNSLGRSSQKSFDAFFLVSVLKPGNVQSLLHGVNENSLALAWLCPGESLVNDISQESLRCEVQIWMLN